MFLYCNAFNMRMSTMNLKEERFYKNSVYSLFSVVSKLLICTTAFIYLLSLFRATPAAYGRSPARRQIEAAAATLHHSHSHARSEPGLRPTPQLTATPDP